MNNDFYVIDFKVEEIVCGFGLSDIGLECDVIDLSGGQCIKVFFVKFFFEKLEILFFDELINYFDEQYIEWLKCYLQEYENVFILIFYDILFLNSVINLIYYVENQELICYVGDYYQFMEVYEVKK